MNQEVQTEEVEIDLLELLLHLKEKCIWIILAFALFATLAGVGTKAFITPMYESTTKLYVSGSNSLKASLTDLQMGSQITADYEEIIRGREIAERIIVKLKLPYDYEELVDMIETSNPSGTHVLEIVITNENPKLAQKIADAYAEEVCTNITEAMGAPEPCVYERANLADEPCSPSLIKNTALGGIAGAVIIGFILTLMFILNDKIKNADQIEKYLQLNTLGVIPVDQKEYDGEKRGAKFWRK
ncbi:MAG: protein-tyrosine kinase [Lachnospiraceae bacterium]|nr:protein-tyrosine kinase [Lachnospiraceae bacterium]